MDLDIILEADLTAPQVKELGLLAEQYGFRAVWTQNYARARDAFMIAVPLALASKKIRVGVCIVSPYEMHPLKMAIKHFPIHETQQKNPSLHPCSRIGILGPFKCL